MQAPFFSVVIPTHNRVDRVERALRSITNQSMDDYEIVVVDDGSSDSTPQYLVGVQSDRCQTLRNEPNRGVSASRNRGVAASRGEFVVFLDDDDEFRPTALTAIRARCEALPELDFLWGARLIHEKDANGREIGTRQDDWSNLQQPIRDTEFLPMVLEIATNSAFAIRRKLFLDVGGFDEQLKVSEDRDLFLRLAERRHWGGAVAEIIIDVDEHFKDSLSRNVGFRAGPDIDLRVIDKHREYLERAEHREFMNTYLLTIFAGFLQAGNRSSAVRIFNELRQRDALDAQVLRKYLRHAPEFRALKSLLRYNSLRRLLGGRDQT
ncbi:MAG: glycosyltransferase family 2 protein [Steroidobacteraceae bacterium]